MSPPGHSFQEKRPQDPPQIPGLGLKRLELRKEVAREICQAVVHLLDLNKNETLSFDEIEKYCRAARLQISAETLHQMFQEADYKRDNRLDVDEIMTAVSGTHQYRKMTEHWLYFIGSFFPQQNIFCFPEELPRREPIMDARERTEDLMGSGTMFQPHLISATTNTPMIYSRPLSREAYVPSKEQEEELAYRQAEFARNRDFWAQKTKAHIVNDHPIDGVKATKSGGVEEWINKAVLPEDYQSQASSKRKSITEAGVMEVMEKLKVDSNMKDTILSATKTSSANFSFEAQQRFDTAKVQELKDSELRVFMKKAANEAKEQSAQEDKRKRELAEKKKREAQREYYRQLTGSPTKQATQQSPKRLVRMSEESLMDTHDPAPDNLSQKSGSSVEKLDEKLFSKFSGVPLTKSYDIGDINFGEPKDPRLNKPITAPQERRKPQKRLNLYFHLSTRIDEKQEAAKSRTLPADGSKPIILEPVPGPYPYRHRDDYNPEEDGRNDFARVFAYRRVSQLHDKKPDVVDDSELWPAEKKMEDLDEQAKQNSLKKELRARNFNCYMDKPRFGMNKFHELGKAKIRPDYRPLGAEEYPGSKPSTVTWRKKWEELMGVKKMKRFDCNGRPLKPGEVDYLKFLGEQYNPPGMYEGGAPPPRRHRNEI